MRSATAQGTIRTSTGVGITQRASIDARPDPGRDITIIEQMFICPAMRVPAPAGNCEFSGGLESLESRRFRTTSVRKTAMVRRASAICKFGRSRAMAARPTIAQKSNALSQSGGLFNNRFSFGNDCLAIYCNGSVARHGNTYAVPPDWRGDAKFARFEVWRVTF